MMPCSCLLLTIKGSQADLPTHGHQLGSSRQVMGVNRLLGDFIEKMFGAERPWTDDAQCPRTDDAQCHRADDTERPQTGEVRDARYA